MPASTRPAQEPLLRALPPVFADFPQPVLHGIFAALPAADLGRAAKLDSVARELVAELWPTLAAERHFPAWWPLQKANVVETASFFDALKKPELWQKGPNKKVEGNTLETGADGSWLWLSGGTDWQGFHGGFRRISAEGLRPSWVSFRVQVATPALSGAFLTLAADTHTWGLEDIALLFNYRGDDNPQDQRCFSIQAVPSQQGGKRVVCRPKAEVTPDRPYEVAINFDWSAGVMSAFIDGERLVCAEPFNVANPVRFVALHNWRADAKTAFSDMALGDAPPCMALSSGPAAVQVRGAPLERWPSLLFALAVLILVCAVVLRVWLARRG